MIRLGQKLKEERIRKDLSLEDVAQATKIRSSFLSAIEKGEYQKLPSSAYAQGFVTNYCLFLGLPKKDSLALFRREFDEKKMYSVLPESLTRNQKFPTRNIRVQQTLILVIIGFILFFAYLFYQYRDAFFGPVLQIDTPKEAVKTGQDVLVFGHTDTNATVSVNNNAVLVSSGGDFGKHLTLFPGEETIHIIAKNRFGKQTEVDRHVIVK